MNITSVLLDEHRVIEQVLNCLERMAERCESHRKLEGPPAQDAITFLRNFIEHCHDCKVKTRLLPAVQAMGVPAEQGVGCALRESREDTRLHLDAMEAAIEPACAGSVAALDKFAEHARKYIDVLLDCIARQEDWLFPLIEEAARNTDRVLPEADDRQCRDDGVCDTYFEVANRLADHLGVPQAAIAAFGDGATDPEDSLYEETGNE